MRRAWHNKVVVIVGASSGMGRATALLLAKKGAHLVLAARREEPLEELARECTDAGASCHVMPIDISDATSARALADEAVRAFGHIDAWLNIAGVYCVGQLEETPDEAFRRVMDINFFGTVNGSRVAVAQFRRQGYGTLINTGSAFSRVTSPYVSAYIASKFAVRGFTSSLRQELQGTGIHVCTVLPAAIDTPLWTHTANYSGLRIKPPAPLYTPERVAHAMLRLLARPEHEVVVGPAGRAGEVNQFQHRLQSHTSGNLFQPMAEGTGARGGFRSGFKQWTRRLLLAGGLLAVASGLRRPRGRHRLGGRRVLALGG
jgi:short-subunit dehydrogenase